MCHRSLRCAAYEALNTWMQCVGSSCGTELFAGDVIQHCLGDCMPGADSLKVDCLQHMFHAVSILMALLCGVCGEAKGESPVLEGRA